MARLAMHSYHFSIRPPLKSHPQAWDLGFQRLEYLITHSHNELFRWSR